MNTPEQIRKAIAIFDEVCDLTDAQRTAALDKHCEGDDQLRDRVEQMLASEYDTNAALHDDQQGGGVKLVADQIEEPTSAVPDRIARHRVIRELGRGGMGVVYEAEQDAPKRRVALKMIQTAGLSPNLIKRFEREAFVLGQLHHPGIAHIYESGTTSVDGVQRPYLAMELIDGQRITAFADSNQLDLRQRLELMARVCDAVQHAHQKGVIHRDIKPANILVVEQGTSAGTNGASSGDTALIDGIGQPKVLDFGVARLTDGDQQAITLQTDVGQIVGTLAYMSPEQVVGDPRNIDTRCDVYALGVVLFQLLTNQLPLDVTGKPIGEAARIIRDEEPRSVSELDRTLRGDIETVIAKALEKDVDRRYTSAAELAADLRRYLRDEPIAARPASTIYQIRKFTRRNPAVVGGAAATFVALVLGLVATAYALVEARDQFARAERERDKAIEARRDADRQYSRQLYVANFQGRILQNLEANEFGETLIAEVLAELERSDKPADQATRQLLRDALADVNSTNVARNVMRGTIIERALQRLDDSDRTPETEARLRYAIAKMYTSLGLLEEAAEQAERALSIEREHLGEQHRWTTTSMDFLATTYKALGRIVEAEALLRESLATRRKHFGEDSDDTVNTIARLAALLEHKGELDEAEKLLKRALDGAERHHGNDAEKTLSRRNTYGILLMKREKFAEAAACFERIMKTRERTIGPDADSTIVARNNLMGALFKLGDFERAAPIAHNVLASSQRVRGDQHPGTITTRNNLGVVLLNLKQYEQAEPVLRKAHQHALALTAKHAVRMKATSNLIDILLATNQLTEAETHCNELIQIRRGLKPAQPGLVAQTLEQLGHVLFNLERFEGARDAWQECVDLRAGISDSHWLTNRARSQLGSALAALQQFPQAEQLLLDSHTALQAQQDVIPVVAGATCLQDARQRIHDLYQAWSKPEQAAKWR